MGKPKIQSVAAAPSKEKKPYFKWTNTVKQKMATYLVEHFDEFKVKKRMAFIRKMKEGIGELHSCDDVQLKNGFTNLISKYNEVRKKLNSSGFGVDPEKDATLDKGWILKQCPYFDILDEKMGSRPNVTPPCFLLSDGIDYGAGVRDEDDRETAEVDIDDDLNIITDDLPEDVETEVPTDLEVIPDNEDLKRFVRSTLSGIKPAEKVKKPKNAFEAFGSIMVEKMSMQNKLDKEKLAFEQEKFTFSRDMDQKKLDAQLFQTLDAAAQDKILEDRRTEREFKMAQLEKVQQFELEKLKLQIDLEKLRKGI